MNRSSDAISTDTASPHNVEQTRQRVALLSGRLDDGYRRIDEAIKTGGDVQDWEDFWISLLEQYEELCDDLAAA